MSTYSINNSTPYKSSFLGSLDPNLFLNKVPNNTSQIIVPENLRDALYTIWDNISFKITSATGSSYSFIGLNGDEHLNNYVNGANGLKVLMGKSKLSNIDILDNDLIEYNTSSSNYTNSDFYFYNFKPDDFDDASPHKQYTKISFLSGDNSNNLFRTAPYILSQQNTGGTAIDFTIYNQGGKLIIDSAEELQIGSANTKVTLLSGTGSTGIKTLPGGTVGDVQINLDNCSFGYINGGSASIGDVLLMGPSNSAYWGSLSINSIFTLNQILTSGNITDGEDLILSTNDYMYIGGTGTTYAYITNINDYTLISSTAGEIRIGADSFRLDITGVGSNKVLYTDITGYAYWATQSQSEPGGSITNIQYHGGTSGFAGSSLFKWDNSIGSMMINSSSNPYSISALANNSGGIYLNGNNQENMVKMENSGLPFFQIYNTDNGYVTNINNNDLLEGTPYALSVKVNDNGGIHLDTKTDGEDGTEALTISNEEGEYFEIKMSDSTNPIVDINNSDSLYALNVKHNSTGGLYINSNDGNNTLLIENSVSGDTYFKIDSSSNKYITFDEGREFGFIFGDASTSYNNKFTFVNSSSRKHFTFLSDSSNNEFRLEYMDRSSVKSSAISFSPGGNDGMYMGVVSNKNAALYLGSHNTSLSSYSPSVVIYPALAVTPNLIERETTQTVVIGGSNTSGQVLGTEVSTDSSKRSLGINIVPEVDNHINGVQAIVPSTESAYTVYNEQYNCITDISTSYILLDSEGLQESTLHRVGTFIESTKVTSYGTTIRLWNRTGGSISVDHLLNFNSNIIQNIFFPEKANSSAYTWLTGYMIELVYLPSTSGDIANTITSLGGSSTLLTEQGIWYKVN